MSEFYQPGQHPDADQLSAFAEDALPAHEREQTLVHLAGCADCRTIVSLALPPIEDVPQVQPAAVRRPWFYGWNVAWLAGAGLAALIVLTVHVHNGTHDAGMAGGTPTQTAAVRPAAPPPPAAMEPSAAKPTATNAAPPPAMKAASPAPPPTADSGADLKSPPAGTTISGQEITNLPLQGRRFLAQPQQQQMTQQQMQQQNGPLRGSASGAGVGGVARDRLSPYVQNNIGNYASQNAGVTAAAAPVPPPPPPPIVSAQAPSAPAATARSAPQAIRTIDVSNADVQVATMDGVPPMTIAPGVVGIAGLPSHLAIASTITRGDQMLALDTAGTLFLSSNNGNHWKRIAAPWPGRALRVTLASLPIPAKQLSGSILSDAASGTVLTKSELKPASGPSIAGVITDPSGAIIPGVSLKITDTRTGLVRTTTSDRNGHYAVAGLVPAVYQIDASAPAFKTQRRSVTLAAGEQSAVNLSLQVGAANETIEVNAAQLSLDTRADKKAQRIAKDVPLSEPSSVFEITTDGGEIWTSADGKSWKRK